MALLSMKETFAVSDHRPSPEQWDAIGEYLDHAEHAANGDLAPRVYLSPIPAGTGKSVAVAAFAGALCQHPLYEGAGVLIAVNRRSEARDMANALAPFRCKLAVIAADKAGDDLAELGDHAEAVGAQVVITTQAMLKASLRERSDFNNAARYFYRGARRPVVLWDEAIAFNRPVSLGGYEAAKLASRMGLQSDMAAKTLLRWAADLGDHAGRLCAVPDFRALGVDFTRLEIDAGADDHAPQARALSILSGETTPVLKVNGSGAGMATYFPEVPPSIMPVLVTDASAARGVHHASYEMMARHRPVTWLKEARKTYGNLTVRLVPRAASRSVYDKPGSKDAKELLNMLVRYIRRVDPNPVLVVSYARNRRWQGIQGKTIAEAVGAMLTPNERGRVAHVTWGQHTATNEHRDVRHVIFAGLNFLPEQAAHAGAGAALDMPMRTLAPTDHPTPDQVRDMERGMLRDSTLQAVLRGHARKGVDGDCGEQEVVIPQSPQKGLSVADLEGMFPGCRIVKDRSLLPHKPLRGKLLAVSRVVQAARDAGAQEITDPSIYDALGMKRQHYARLKKKDEWAAWLASMGWHQAKLGGGVTGLRRSPA